MRTRNEGLDIFNGIVIAFGFNIIAGFFLLLLAGILGQISAILTQFFLLAIASIGIFQVVYILPYALKLKREGQFGMMKGVIIGAVIVALLNGACWLSLTRAYK
jgi:hypothetical protein